MFVFDTGKLTPPRYIINFPTKRRWRGKSRIEDIEAGLEDLVKEIRARNIRSIAIPPLGSGLGGLDWAKVRPLIERALAAVPEVDTVVFEPGGGPIDGRANRSSDVPKMTAGRAALLGLMDRYLAARPAVYDAVDHLDIAAQVIRQPSLGQSEWFQELLQENLTRARGLSLTLHGSYSSVVVDDVNFRRPSIGPTKNDAPLVVDADTIKFNHTTFQRFQPIAGR